MPYQGTGYGFFLLPPCPPLSLLPPSSLPSPSLSSPLPSYAVVRGTPERMLDHLISCDIDENQEASFANDFFLTHPAFISTADLCKGILTRYRQREEDVEEEVNVTRKKRTARAVAVWVRTAKSQLVKDAVFLKLLQELQDGLEEDRLKEEQDILNVSLSESIRSAILGKHTQSPILGGSLLKVSGRGCGL